MKRNQLIYLIIKLTLLLCLVSCGPAEGEAVPTAIIGSQVELIPRETAVPTPALNVASTPTLASESSDANEQETVPSSLNSIGDPFAPELGNLGYDVLAYDIRLAFEPALAEIEGGVIITAVATQSLPQFSLDFIGYDISELLVNDEPAPLFTRRGQDLN